MSRVSIELGVFMSRSCGKKTNTLLVGRKLGPDIFKVDSEMVWRYARAVNDDNVWYSSGVNGGGVVAPPLFGIVPAMRVLRKAIANDTLPLPVDQTVHGEHEMTFISPIRPGDVLHTDGRVCTTEKRSSGTTVNIELITSSCDGTPRLRQLLTAFVRDNVGTQSPKFTTKVGEPPLVESAIQVGEDQSINYAKASFTEGISVHEDHEAARELGYRTHFLQGQCTIAFATKVIVDNLAGGNPTRLFSIKVRLSQVVYPGDVLTTRVWPGNSPGKFEFETVKRDNTLVLSNGTAGIEMIED